jgi:hypothetical protein
MKHTLLLGILISQLSFSQITINETDFANSNDTVRVSLSNEVLDFSATGTNFIWDFSQITASEQRLNSYNSLANVSFLTGLQFGNFAPTPYIASYFQSMVDFPLGDITALPVTIEDVNQFTRKTSDSLTSIGYSFLVNGTELAFRSDTIEKNYDYPINYGDNTFSRGYTRVDLNPIYNGIWVQHRVHTSNVDGWGQITTPYGTFDALRIKHVIEESDSVYTEAFGFPTWIPLPLPTTNIYEWWTQGEKEPILKVITNESPNGETIVSTTYRDHFIDMSADISNQTLENEVFPNPFEEKLTIKIEEQIEQINIFDNCGKIVFSENCLNQNEITILVPHLIGGIYTIQIITQQNIYNNRLEKK